MKTTTKQHSSVYADAFRVLLEKFGPQKTADLWSMLSSAHPTEYRAIRHKLFEGKTLATLAREAKKFNRK